jgi:hypothetical protein
MDFDHRDQDRLEELVQKTRWDEVADARQRVLERLQAIDRLQFDEGGATRKNVSTLKQRTVQLYVQQVETILDPVEGETTSWWNNRHIAHFELPNGEQIVIQGLEGYVSLGEQVSYTVEVEHKPFACHVGETRERERSMTPPPEIHKRAFRATNRALADQGVEFDTRNREIGDEDAGPAGGL